MELRHQHAQSQRTLRQRNVLAFIAAGLAGVSVILLFTAASRDREVVLQPILRSPLTISSSGVSRDYLEMVTRDVAVLTLDRSPQNLEYWMDSVLAITAPGAQGELKAELLKIVDEQRGSSIAQYFAIQSMELDTQNLTSEVTGELNTIVGSKVVNRQRKTFRFTWKYSGVSLQLIGFGIVTKDKEKEQ